MSSYKKAMQIQINEVNEKYIQDMELYKTIIIDNKTMIDRWNDLLLNNKDLSDSEINQIKKNYKK